MLTLIATFSDQEVCQHNNGVYFKKTGHVLSVNDRQANKVDWFRRINYLQRLGSDRLSQVPVLYTDMNCPNSGLKGAIYI
jgi:hypothetical protein